MRGLLLLALGDIGTDVGKIDLETKGRPRFLVQELLEGETDLGPAENAGGGDGALGAPENAGKDR